MVGLSDGYDLLVTCGDPATNAFITFYLKHGRLIAADAVSRLGDSMAAREWVAGWLEVDPAALADEATPLKSLTGRAAIKRGHEPYQSSVRRRPGLYIVSHNEWA
jgi:3-phenylpropionate/trans-cinnamate dioxygenase ferredoxin reductase subunit